MEQTYEIVQVDSLLTYPGNPRRGNTEVIGKSISRNGFYGAIVIQKSTRNVLAGNHRLMAAKEQGLDTIPAIIVDVDDATAKRILLADNRTNDLAEYDEAALAALLVELTEDAGSVDGLLGTGFEMPDLDLLLNSLDAANGNQDGPDLGAGGAASGAVMIHLQWGKVRVPLSVDDVALLDKLLKDYIQETGSQYGFLQYLLEVDRGQV